MADDPSLIDRELSSPAFVRDLRSFLSLGAETLRAIADIGDQPDGFVGIQQAQRLQDRSLIPTDTAMAHLRVADYLYRRAIQQSLNPTRALEQIASIASAIDEPVVLDDDRKKAITSILTFKHAYDVARATRQALTEGPHLISANAYWNIKLVTLPDGEVIRVPFVGLNIVWHDSAENGHEMFLQMSESDWDEFTDKIVEFNTSRADVSEYL